MLIIILLITSVLQNDRNFHGITFRVGRLVKIVFNKLTLCFANMPLKVIFLNYFSINVNETGG